MESICYLAYRKQGLYQLIKYAYETQLRQMYDTQGKPNPAMDYLNLTQFQIDTSPDIKIMICFVGGIDCTAKENFIVNLKI